MASWLRDHSERILVVIVRVGVSYRADGPEHTEVRSRTWCRSTYGVRPYKYSKLKDVPRSSLKYMNLDHPRLEHMPHPNKTMSDAIN